MTEFNNSKIYINNILSKYCDDNIENNFIKEIVIYSLNGGKRLRPIICYSLCKKINCNDNDIEKLLVIIEYLHSASLILDDLPCMDNDSLRRGLETIHKKYGVSTAYIISNYMINCALKEIINLSKNSCSVNDVIEFICTQNSHVAIGQLVDLSENFNIANLNEIIVTLFSNKYILALKQKSIILKEESIIKSIISLNLKTFPLFYLSFQLPFLISDIKNYDIDIIQYISFCFSVLFQLADDFEDYDKDKFTGKNDSHIKILGKIEASKLYYLCVEEFLKTKSSISYLNLDIFDYIIKLLNKKMNLFNK